MTTTTTTAKKAAAATDTAQKAYENIAAAGNEAVKEGYERSVKFFGELGDFNKQNFDAFVESANAAAKNGETIATDTIAFAKTQIETGVEATKKALSAKSAQELFELQSDFIKKSFDSFVSQMNAMSEKVTSATKETAEPISGRVNAFVEMVQGARA